MSKNIIIGVIVGILVIGGGSFYAGTKFAVVSQAGRSPMGQDGQFRSGQKGQGFGGARAGQGMRGSITAGQILSKDNTSITVKLADGGSKIVLLSSLTAINKTQAGTDADLIVGENVVVMGQANSDGSVNAQSIQLGSGAQFRQTWNQTSAN